MQLVYFSMLLAAFLGAISDELLHRETTEYCLTWCLGAIAVLGATGKYAASISRHRIAATRKIQIPLANFQKQHQRILWLWIALMPFYLSFIGWGAYAKAILPNVGSLAWTFAWWCFPSVLLMTLLDAARYQLYRSTGVKVVSGARYGWIVIMLPCLATSLLWDASISVSGGLVGAERTSPIAVAGLLTILMGIVLPFLMIKLWSTEPIQDTAKGSAAISAWVATGEDPRSIRLWKTDLSIAGAMVLGWSRQFRFLLLSDLLLEKLDRDEIRMIVLHEAAHCRRWHVWLRLLPVWTMSIPIIAVHHVGLWKQMAFVFPFPSFFVVPGVVVVSLVSMCFLLSWIARWAELDADIFSVELAGRQSDAKLKTEEFVDRDPSQRSTFSRQLAARALIRALEKLTPASQFAKETWLHPSLDRRIKSLSQRYFYEPTLLVESVDERSCLSSPL